MQKQTDTAQTVKRFWNIATADDDETATLTLYGDVVSRRPTDWFTGDPESGQFICPEDFAADLETIRDKKNINVKINSVGGDVYTAIAIHNALKALSGRKNVIVEGIAASAASIIAMSGDTIKVFSGSIMMIHNISGLLYDWYTIADLKKVMRMFDACERAAAAIYDGKTKLGEASIRAMMDRETWMTGAEAIEKGFADELIDGEGPEVQYSAENNVILANGIRHNARYLHVPKISAIKSITMAATAPVNHPEPDKLKGAEKMQTIEELKAAYPELVAKIEADAAAAAVAEDRARIKEIEEIQDTIGDAELIAAAKFTKPTNAASLALEAMKKAKQQGLNFMAARAEEGAPANNIKAGIAEPIDPAAIEAKMKADEQQAIDRAADLFKKTFQK